MNEARMENCNCTSLKRPENRRDACIVLFFFPPPSKRRRWRRNYSRNSATFQCSRSHPNFIFGMESTRHTHMSLGRIAPEKGIARVLCFPLSLLLFLAFIFFFFFFFRVLAYSISAKNNNCRSVTLPSRQDIVFKFSATWTERAARNSGCKRAGIVAPYTPFLLESRTCPRGFCSLQKAANNK